MCHTDSSYTHPFRTVMRAAVVLAVATPAVLLAYAHLVVVLAAVAVLVGAAGLAQVADLIGTRRALAQHEAACHAADAARRQLRLEATPRPVTGSLHVASDRPAALEAPAPRVDPEWLAEPVRVRRAGEG